MKNGDTGGVDRGDNSMVLKAFNASIYLLCIVAGLFSVYLFQNHRITRENCFVGVLVCLVAYVTVMMNNWRVRK